ncbi:helix-turn-helix transcriptional regulator [Paenibacillus alba]|uniref:helix-turn-helix domain-containing protein n=1 Tax=Paenibacillus alba TaxID=1197127 RepID=UPI0015661DB5|nr:helix-turn-helix transcriptional regulator [Paenibacillus alba]
MAEPRIGKSHLPELLAKASMTQAQLADHLNVTEGYISQVISGKSRLSVIKRKMAADFLGCTSDDLNEWI